MEMGSFAYPSWLLPAVIFGALAIFGAMIFGQALRPKYRRLYGKAALLHAFQNAMLPSIWVQIYLWLALIVVWTPIWWFSVLASGLTGLGTASAWFFAVFISFYVIWFLKGIAGYSVNRAFEDTTIRDAAPAVIKKRVAVIGAGMAGLVASKELREEGHNVVIFERTSGPGGVWASSKERGGVAWSTTMTSTGALNSTLSDAVSNIYHPEHEKWPRHFNREEFLGVLEDYRDQHNVFARGLRCNTEVLGMELLSDQRWRLSIRDNSNAAMSEEEFDAVTICTGLNKKAFIPDITGQDGFAGPQTHIEDYRPINGKEYAGKRVLVVGLGETSSDVVKDLVDNGTEHVYISQRGATFVIPRDVANLPADHVETRLAHDGPMFHRFATIFLGIAPATLFPLLSSYRIRPTIFRHFWRITVLNHPKKWELWRLGSLNWTKSDHIYGAMESGHATVLRDIDRFGERSVVFADGNEVKIDAVIYASGYRPGKSLLPAIEGAGKDTPLPASARDLYKLTIPPYHPNVAVIGYARGQIGAITVSSEIQARWWALLVSQKRSLPEAAEMAKFTADMRRNGRRFHQSNRTTGTFGYSVARQEIGCEPDMFKLFFTDIRLWHAVLLGPICSAHFRLRGHGARLESARQQVLWPNGIQSDNYIDSVDLYANTLPLAALLIPAYGFYSAVLPGFVFRNATRCYI